jgi:hypothetical protein
MIWNHLVELNTKVESQNLPKLVMGLEVKALFPKKDHEILSICLKDYMDRSKRAGHFNTLKTLRKKSFNRVKTVRTKLKSEFPVFSKFESNRRFKILRQAEMTRVRFAKELTKYTQRYKKISAELADIQRVENIRFSKIENHIDFDDYEESEDSIRVTFLRKQRSLENRLKVVQQTLDSIGNKHKVSVEIPITYKKDIKSIRLHRKNDKYYYMVLKHHEIEAFDTLIDGSCDVGIASKDGHLSVQIQDLKTDGRVRRLCFKNKTVRTNNYELLHSLFKIVGDSSRFVFLSNHKEDTKNSSRDINLILKRLGRARQAEGAIVFKIIQDTGILSKRRLKNTPHSVVLADACMDIGYAEIAAPKCLIS